MNKPRILILTCCALFSIASFAQRTAFDDSVRQIGKRGDDTWSKLAYALPQYWDSLHTSSCTKSPDGLKALCVSGKRTGKPFPSDWEIEIFVRKDGVRMPGNISPYNSPEALWSPDSAALAITATDGGLTGNWVVQIYFVNAERLRSIDVTQAVRGDLARSYPPCKGSYGCTGIEKNAFKKLDWVNVAAFKWLDGSKQIALSAGVPNVSIYGSNAGKEKGYLVGVPSGRIIETLTRSAFLGRWKEDINTLPPY